MALRRPRTAFADKLDALHTADYRGIEESYPHAQRKPQYIDVNPSRTRASALSITPAGRQQTWPPQSS